VLFLVVFVFWYGGWFGGAVGYGIFYLLFGCVLFVCCEVCVFCLGGGFLGLGFFFVF